MKCTTIIDPSRSEEIIIYAKQRSELTDEIEKLCSDTISELIGYNGKEAAIISLCDVVCFTVTDGKVFAVTENERLMLKERLYVIEKRLPHSFIRINQSCIANRKKIKKFDASISGTLLVRFAGGHTDYVSRRSIKAVKERLGL